MSTDPDAATHSHGGARHTHAHGHTAAAPQLRDFHLAFLFIAVVALGPVVDSLGLPPDAGAATSGHRQTALEVNPA